MKTIGLKRIEMASVDNFTNRFKMKVRRALFPATRLLIQCNTKLISKKDVVVDSRPELDDKEQYIFAATHHFTEDIEASIGTLDRNAWVLLGTKDQIENNYKMYGAWLNGMIYVDRKDPRSRRDSLLKMKYVLDNGSSILIFPEGGWNNKENDLVLNPFSGAYYLASECNKKVVPMASIYSEQDDKIHVVYGDPIDLAQFKSYSTDSSEVKKIKKAAANSYLKDSMASLMYKLMEKYAPKAKREEMEGDLHLQHTDTRIREYMKSEWSEPEDIKDEFTEYKPKYDVDYKDVQQRAQYQTMFEKTLIQELFACVNDYGLSITDAQRMFRKLKFAKNQYEAMTLAMTLRITMLDLNIWDEIENIETEEMEPYFRGCELKNITYQDDVWSFLDNVEVDKDNAFLAKAKLEREKELKDRKKYDLGNYVDNNFYVIEFENDKDKAMAKRKSI